MPEISHRRPTFTEAEAAEIVVRLYGRSGRLTPLPGERDQNFRLDTLDGEQFVLKIAGQTEPPEALAMQNKIMAFVILKYHAP